ncbi:peptidoglycan editing factor PgeF [Paramagnetospirillum kuznetsovii]|uniref:Purine nucleoside phosphorylase n=1 Tax=Paramagnetospirillum kuznetsovii TaxID=2053833 RepID=A0A364P183_9PROT|nr:peptidoglycan editing factor PgeF [Paramagnetospirillum kuznetsovii]RAU23108.1 peptidoglycan editing factor PgeF [Paramagnetospirillum kuznetsovii]
MITLSALNDFTRIRHGFFTREGGVSEGIYASLNCGAGSKDDPKAVVENRRRAMALLDLPVEALCTVYQTHSSDVVVVTEPLAAGQPARADAMVTNRPGIALGILTADCAPVLLADGKAGIVGAAHAGWKGALGGVLDNTVKAMVALGAKPANIVAAMGPCIGHRSYEVGPEFPAPFLAEDKANLDFFAPSPRERHALFDLPGYISRKLAGLGVIEVTRVPADTLRDGSRFFSYRRATLNGEPDYGRQLSAIVLER